MGISSLFSIAGNGLGAYQTQMDAISNNIANADTPGYRTETAEMTAIPGTPLTSGVSAGGGVHVSDITRHVDLALQRQLFSAAITKGASDARSNALSTVSSGLSESSTQFSASLNSFANALTTLSQQPSATAARVTVLSTAQSLASSANQIQDALETASTGYTKQVSDLQSNVTQEAAHLADLNRSILYLPPQQSGSIKDSALEVAKDLAAKTGGRFWVGDRGTVDFSLPNGKGLVQDVTSKAMVDTDVPSAGGQMGGLLQVKADTDGYRQTFTTALQAMVTQFNTVHQQGTDGNGNAGAAFFNLNGGGRLAVAISNADEVAAGRGGGVEDNANASQLANLPNTASPLTGATLSADFNALVAKAGADSQSASATAASADGSYDALDAKQKRTEGVDVDKQAVAMTQAQKMYQAMAQILATENSMLGTLLDVVKG